MDCGYTGNLPFVTLRQNENSFEWVHVWNKSRIEVIGEVAE